MCPTVSNTTIKPGHTSWNRGGSTSPPCAGPALLTWKGKPDVIAAAPSLDMQQPVSRGNLFRDALPRVTPRGHTRCSGLSSRPQCCSRPNWSARPRAWIVQGPSISGSLVECAMDGQQDVADGDKIVASPGRTDNEWMRQHMAGDNDLR
jgi:hypothetical protein